MSIRHQIQNGECLGVVARTYGSTPDNLWNAAENSQLRQHRTRSTLIPGDVVVIPDRPPKELSLRTGAVSRFVAAVEVCLTVQFSSDEATADFEFLLTSADRAYRQQRNMANDLVRDGDAHQLHFCGLRPAGRYTLRCGPAGQTPSITVFEDTPYADLAEPYAAESEEQPTGASAPAEDDSYPDQPDAEEST
jgi:hypothetical protein